MRLLFLLIGLLVASPVEAQTCSASNRCALECCNKNGWCGFGPDYCGKDVCVADCDRKSDCNPGYGAEWAKKDKCPLNVCCSKSGYCGTTKDFCGDKKVKRPSCDKNNGVSRVIGYYEGWAPSRPCNKIYPEQIPIGVYTHINFAFATINPKTFEVQPADNADINIYRRLVRLRKKDPGLKVFVAIGGWTFNDPGATRTTFSDLAASVPRQQNFIKSLVSFMSTYGFDGVDLDWEYPEAEDRGGRGVDYANFPKFLNRLKSGLAATGGKDGLSITLPCSYWYLQHFDLKALAKEVSWFNMMSYDMHGVWDKPNKYVGPYLNAHTNMTEIQDLGLDLLWRSGVDPNMVVMGVAFYGRSFTASSAACLTPGCTFEAGGNRGKCSREIGILMNSEIDDLVKQKNIKPTWYRSAAVKVATWDSNQWVSFDDADTLRQKAEQAQSLCLGGLMVWAISHDTQDGKYSRALGRVANRRVTALPDTDGDAESPYKKIEVPVAQCKWTNCGEGCPPGWALMRRSDPGARGEEYMFDEQHCDGGRSHLFCCPTDSTFPICGWYTHNNGACDGQCPPNTIEIGSNSLYCNNYNYQAACCTFDVPSMRVYSTCEWGAWPYCFQQAQCPWVDSSKTTAMGSSTSGSGGSECWGTFDTRKRCCNTADKMNTFGSCRLFWDYGLAGSDKTLDNYCWSGCPPEYTRVAMDSGLCYGKDGAPAICCIASVSKTVEVENPILAEYRSATIEYLKNPTCDNPLLISKRDGDTTGLSVGPRDVAVALNSDEAKTENLLLLILEASATPAMLDAARIIWDNTVGNKFKNLQIENLRKFLKSAAETLILGLAEIVHRILCSPHLWDQRASAAAGKTPALNCADGSCNLTQDLVCSDPDNPASDVRGRGGGHWTKRQHLVLLDGHNGVGGSGDNRNFSSAAARGLSGESLHVALVPTPKTLSKRIPRDYTATFRDAQGREYSITVTLPDHPSAGTLEPDDPNYDEAVDFTSPDDCSDTSLSPHVIPNGRLYEVEHPIDGQLLRNFIQDAAQGVLPTGATLSTGRISASFFTALPRMNLPFQNLPPLPGGQNYIRPLERVMECLGSGTNLGVLLLTYKEINRYKGRLVVGENAVADDKWELKLANMDKPSVALAVLRTAIAVIRYMDRRAAPNANGRLATVVTDVHSQWVIIETEWNRLNPHDTVRVSVAWREWARAQMTQTVSFTQGWVRVKIKSMREVWAVRTGDVALGVLETLNVLEAELPGLSIDVSAFP